MGPARLIRALRDRWFLVACLTLVSTAVSLYLLAGGGDGERPEVFPAGSELPSGLVGLGSGEYLLLAVRSDCQYCVESSSFYKVLLEHSHRFGVEVIVVTSDPPGIAKSTLFAELDVDIRQLPQFDIRGTPAIVLVTSDKVVVASWLGQLPPVLEQRVLATVADRGRVAAAVVGPQ